MRKKILGMIMAGGKGERLGPLTRDRAKPAVPFGGKYRIIDFVLSNFINSGIYSIYVLTQFKSQSLTEHLETAWRLPSLLRDQFIIGVPAQMRIGETWYLGTADAIYQNLDLVLHGYVDTVAVFGGDHIYRMDIGQMISWHEGKRADATVAALPVPIGEASRFGVIKIDDDWRIIGFEEKPANPTPIPGRPDMALASMGNYIFDAGFLVKALARDAANPRSSHDFGKDVLPANYRDARIYAYDFFSNVIPGDPEGERNTYWRDVGTVDAYWEAHMDMRAVKPLFNVYNYEWPIRAAEYNGPPAKFVHEAGFRVGRAVNSLVCEGSILSGCTVKESIVGRNCHIHSFSEVYESIIMDNVEIDESVQLKRVIVDKNVCLKSGTKIGFDLEEDKKKYFVSDGGVVVIPREPRRKSLAAMEF